MYKDIAANKRRTALLIFLFILFIMGFAWFFSYVLDYGPDLLIIAFIFSVIMALFSYYQGDQVALWTAGAVPIKKEDNPYIYRLVENLCIADGLPLPKIYIIPDDAPNAFATGRDPQHASIAITSGIIGMLESNELEGVIAHELSHVKNYDIRVTTIVIVLVGLIAIFSDIFLRSTFWGNNRRNRDEGNVGVILFFIGIILAILSPLIAQLIQLAISRKREFLADASGALLTRYPDGLASALEKISTYQQPMRHANTATAYLYIVNPFFSAKSISNLFSTHPPIAERIKRLRNMGR